MDSKRYLIVGLISFGFGVLVGWHPTFESVRSFIVGGLSLGLVIEMGGFLREWFKERKEENSKRCEILEGYLRDHSKDLVNDVFKKWFEPSLAVRLMGRDLPIIAQTSLEEAHYETHSKSRIEDYIELYNLEYNKQAIEHIKEYNIWSIWLECENLSKTYLEKAIKIAEGIEKKVSATTIQEKFNEWDGNGTNPPTCYILRNTVYAIYQEANRFMIRGEFYGLFKKEPEQGFFSVGSGQLYAKSSDESFADEFIKIVYEIAKDKTLIEQLKLLDAEKKIIDNKVEKFKQGLRDIIDDFGMGHYILKGTCSRCNLWVDELISLDNSLYKKLIPPPPKFLML